MALTVDTQGATFFKQLLHEMHQDPESVITIHKNGHICIALGNNSMTT
jgi:hypothetical protein